MAVCARGQYMRGRQGCGMQGKAKRAGKAGEMISRSCRPTVGIMDPGARSDISPSHCAQPTLEPTPRAPFTVGRMPAPSSPPPFPRALPSLASRIYRTERADTSFRRIRRQRRPCRWLFVRVASICAAGRDAASRLTPTLHCARKRPRR
jgi:hypothetical protein